MRTRALIPLVAVALTGAALAVTALRPGASLLAEFERRLARLSPGLVGEPLAEADIAHLPTPVQRYLRRAGALGKPPVTMVHTTFNATLYSAQAGLACRVLPTRSTCSIRRAGSSS